MRFHRMRYNHYPPNRDGLRWCSKCEQWKPADREHFPWLQNRMSRVCRICRYKELKRYNKDRKPVTMSSLAFN